MDRNIVYIVGTWNIDSSSTCLIVLHQDCNVDRMTSSSPLSMFWSSMSLPSESDSFLSNSTEIMRPVTESSTATVNSELEEDGSVDITYELLSIISPCYSSLESASTAEDALDPS